MPVMPRASTVVLPILRAALPGVTVTTWGADIDYREFPFINIRRVGGIRYDLLPGKFNKPVFEMTAYGAEGLPETELLYETALDALYRAVQLQTLTTAGHLHSIKETMGMTQFSSPFQDSWRVQGLIQLGVRAPLSLT